MNLPQHRILCAERDADTCQMLSVLLRPANYKIKSVSTLAEALRLARAESFDLYLIGSLFNDGTGFELCRRIREFDSTTPVVFFSGLAHEADRQRGLEAGAQFYLVKPNDLASLVETIRRLVEKQKFGAAA